MRWLPALVILISTVVHAGPVPCGHETTARGRALCLDLRVRVLRNRIGSLIDSTAAGLDSAAGPGVRRFGHDPGGAQRGWQRRTDRECRAWGTDPVLVQMCRLAETRARLTHIRYLLSDVREQAGLPALPRFEDLDIRVPLARPPGGPGLDLTLPVPVPDP